MYTLNQKLKLYAPDGKVSAIVQSLKLFLQNLMLLISDIYKKKIGYNPLISIEKKMKKSRTVQ